MHRRSDQNLPDVQYLRQQKEIVSGEVTVTINGKVVQCPRDWTILRACYEVHINVPTLCHHPSLPSTGKCGLCVVQVERILPSLPTTSLSSSSSSHKLNVLGGATGSSSTGGSVGGSTGSLSAQTALRSHSTALPASPSATPTSSPIPSPTVSPAASPGVSPSASPNIFASPSGEFTPATAPPPVSYFSLNLGLHRSGSIVGGASGSAGASSSSAASDGDHSSLSNSIVSSSTTTTQLHGGEVRTSVEFVKACKTLVEDGMVVTTNTPEVYYRGTTNLQEFLGTRTLESISPRTPEIEDILTFTRKTSTVPEVQQQYALVRDQNLCCLCTRCVRVCSEVQNMNVLQLNTHNPLAPIAFEKNLPLHATSCIACGQCAAVCPTGAVSERNDVDIVLRELGVDKTAANRKTVILQTAPTSRISVGELMGEGSVNIDDNPNLWRLVEAAHGAGFDFVFDTTFAADTCATLEAIELLQRVKAGGPFPLFTSCCPGWVRLVEHKYPHLRALVSKCRSPMMMLGSMIRSWMKNNNVPRTKYFVVAVMPCVAKKEEINKPELRDSHGHKDVDVVLTVREMALLLKSRLSPSAWSSYAGKGKASYDEPFAVASGGGTLFSSSGGVTEAALRVAFTCLTQDKFPRADVDMFDQCRQVTKSDSWIETAIDVSPTKPEKNKQLEVAIISGARKIQEFLSSQGLEDAHHAGKTTVRKHFVECMACPGGCIGGGGQPRSNDPCIIPKRKSQIYKLAAACEEPSSYYQQQQFQETELCGVASKKARKLLEYYPPVYTPPPAALRKGLRSGDDFIGSVGNVAILYGSQGGFTASYAYKLHSALEKVLGEGGASIHAMDHFPIQALGHCTTLILLTSTWQSENNRNMPYNAQKFWDYLCNLPHDHLSSYLAGTRFSVLGFGSSIYDKFCVFADQLNDMLRRLGASPMLPVIKIDIERPDKGQRPFTRWMKEVEVVLMRTELPEPQVAIIPAIAAGKPPSRVCPRGYNMATVKSISEYKNLSGTGKKFFCVQLSVSLNPQPGEHLYILPCNPTHDVEQLLSTHFPGVANVSVNLFATGGKPYGHFPTHISVKQLFEQFLDLYAKPHKKFLEALVDANTQDHSTQPPFDFSKDCTYMSILMQMKVVPSLEVLVSVIPPLLPRCYTPLFVENCPPNCLFICVKQIENGLCSQFLINGKKGDKLPVFLGHSDFPQPNLLDSEPEAPKTAPKLFPMSPKQMTPNRRTAATPQLPSRFQSRLGSVADATNPPDCTALTPSVKNTFSSSRQLEVNPPRLLILHQNSTFAASSSASLEEAAPHLDDPTQTPPEIFQKFSEYFKHFEEPDTNANVRWTTLATPEGEPGSLGVSRPFTIHGGTVFKLVQYLTHSEECDPDFSQSFFVSYVAFVEESKLIDMLIARFFIRNPETLDPSMFSNIRTTVRARVINVLKTIYEDISDNPELVQKVTDALTLFSGYTTVAGAVLKKLQNSVPPVNLTADCPPPIVLSPVVCSILDMHPEELARQISIVEWNLWKKIKPKEFVTNSWNKTTKGRLAPNITAMILESNKRTLWAITEVISIATEKDRALAIHRLILVADICYKIRNFNGLLEIVSGLQNSAVHRLKKSWAYVPAQSQELFEKYCVLLDPSANFAAYRNVIKSAVAPCIPHLGMILTDVTFANDGNPDLIAGTSLVNFAKWRSMSGIVKGLKVWQVVGPNFREVEAIQAYLRIYKPKTADDAFDISKCLEPTTTLTIAAIKAQNSSIDKKSKEIFVKDEALLSKAKKAALKS
ncbi:Fe-hydrogenase 2 [Pelomyxa schiedti]|nr:Fe-hydrogenase 2 [Pelomyxa schiedti]